MSGFWFRTTLAMPACISQLAALEKDGETMLKGCSSLIKSHQQASD